MTTRVVRISEPHDFYIGRAGRGRDGFFGSPVVLGRQCPQCCDVHETRGSTLPCFRAYMVQRLRRDVEYRRRVYAMQGWTLGCFCKPDACHGDVYAEFLDSLTPDDLREERFPELRGAGERSGASSSPARDALRRVREARAQAPLTPAARGDVYVSGGLEYELWRVDADGVVLRPLRGRGYIVTESTGPLDPAKWRKR